jgi:hypothetical protein
MFELLIWSTIIVAVVALLYVYDGCGDVLHPLMITGPMLIFLYGWMPLRLNGQGALEGYFSRDQLVDVQLIYFSGVLMFVLGSVSVDVRFPRLQPPMPRMNRQAARVLLAGGFAVGLVGLAAWLISIVNVGGITEAFSRPYSGGWDDSGYIRDGSTLMFPAALLIITAGLGHRFTPVHLMGLAMFLGPWALQAVLTARRGPTFMIVCIAGAGWFLNRRTRPPVLVTTALGLCLGYAILFLVVNRGQLYLGSDFDFKTDVASFAEQPNNGNEYIYGTGTLLSAEYTQKFFWGRRYLAEVLVRPIPKAVWPNKYADVGLEELTNNAGTGEGFQEALGWQGADGSAPGLISDLWLEFRWLVFPVMWLLGRALSTVWKNAVTREGVWVAQYAICLSLSIYFVMQTMEAVIFRILILSLPVWLVWNKAARNRSEYEPYLLPEVYETA